MILYGSILAAFLAYHAWRWARARPHPGPEPVAWRPPADAPRISFLVPAWRAKADIAGFVEAFRSLAYPDKELVLCAGGDDGSYRAAEELAGADVVVVRQRATDGKQGALEACYRASSGEILYLTDVDCRPDDEAVHRVLEPIATGLEEVVTGASVPCESQHVVPAVVVGWAIKRAAYGSRPRYLDGLLGRNCALTREAAVAVGGFRFAAPTGTDFRLAQELRAAGYRVWFEPRSEMRTEYPWPFGVLVRKQARWLRNVLLYAQHPRQTAEFGDAVVVSTAPFGVVALIVGASLAGHPLPAFLAGLLLLHGLANRLHYVRLSLEPRFLSPSLLLGIAQDLLGTMAAGAYAVFSLLTPASRRRW